jgi:complex iron-sulfur molybdoenzyme family reductase subunit alpha
LNVTPLPGHITSIASLANDRDVCQFVLDNAPETQGFTVAGEYRFTSDNQLLLQPDSSIIKHPKRFPATSETWTSDIVVKNGIPQPYYCFQRMFEHLQPLGTQTGRQQFYLDHDWMLKDFKEELPVYKGIINADRDAKGKLLSLRWSTPHGRWSIHSTWRDAKFQLRLQRGRTVVYLNPAEAAKRGLRDNDLVEVFNGHGAVQVHLDISSRIPPGQALMYHGWERYQNNTGWQAPTGIRINPTQLIGKYGQMTFRLNYWGPTGNQKDTLVEIRKVR